MDFVYITLRAHAHQKVHDAWREMVVGGTLVGMCSSDLLYLTRHLPRVNCRGIPKNTAPDPREFDEIHSERSHLSCLDLSENWYLESRDCVLGISVNCRIVPNHLVKFQIFTKPLF